MKKTLLLTNENGSVVVLAMIMLVLLTLLGMAVTRSSSIEVQIASNDKKAVDNLYKAEAAGHLAIELTSDWMTNTFLVADPDAVAASRTIPPTDLDGDSNPDVDLDIDNDGNPDVRIEIRCIESTGATISGLSTEANNLPTLQHITIPPVGSGNSLEDYEVRRYGITGTTLNAGGQALSRVQLGAYKVFNNFN